MTITEKHSTTTGGSYDVIMLDDIDMEKEYTQDERKSAKEHFDKILKTQDTIQNNFYIYKFKDYQRISSGLMKVDGKFVESVNYKALYHIDGLPIDTIFTRTKQDFESKFRLRQRCIPQCSLYVDCVFGKAIAFIDKSSGEHMHSFELTEDVINEANAFMKINNMPLFDASRYNLATPFSPKTYYSNFIETL